MTVRVPLPVLGSEKKEKKKKAEKRGVRFVTGALKSFKREQEAHKFATVARGGSKRPESPIARKRRDVSKKHPQTS